MPGIGRMVFRGAHSMQRIASGRRAVVGVLAISLAAASILSACSGTDGPELGLDAPDNKHLSPAERELRTSVRKDRQMEGALTGCVAGGLLGGIVKAVTGGSTKEVAQTAAVGCLVGGVVGVAWG